MRFVYFTQSIRSCWNHGNVHFLRGLARALLRSGHAITLYEPEDSWSRVNLLRSRGPEAEEAFARIFPDLAANSRVLSEDLDAMLHGAEVVIVHEWNDPALVAAIGRKRAAGAAFRLLFHDTHHRMVSDPEAMAAFDLSGYDAVLAFGESLSEVYRGQGWGDRVFTWHQAADSSLFRPPETPRRRYGAVWTGNWGDGERSDELIDYMFDPIVKLAIPLDVYGVRYPDEALAELAKRDVRYHGWTPNTDVPGIFAHRAFTVHVPRRAYVAQLPGIPTIRVFEALACGIPLLSAPWLDSENLFTEGRDFVMARSPDEMTTLMRDLTNDSALRVGLVAHGLRTILLRHTCDHRAAELRGIVAKLQGVSGEAAA
jgi:spore maturation protein CgeB